MIFPEEAMRVTRVKRVAWILLAATVLIPQSARAQSGDTVIYYHTDTIGSVRMITDASGAEIARYDFLPFGEPWPPAQTPTDVRQFAGKERDPETKLDYFGARYYRADSARFISVDPVLDAESALVDPQRWNRYSYAKNNPSVFVDPDGRDLVKAMYSQASIERNGRIRDAVAGFLSGDHPHAKLARRVADSILAGFLPRNNEEVVDAASAEVFGLAAPLEIGVARLKPVSLPAWRNVAVDMTEVVSGHTSSGSRAIQSGIKSLFPDEMSPQQIEAAIRNAYRYGKKISAEGDRVKIRGPWQGGTIQLWLNKVTKTIETAHPVP